MKFGKKKENNDMSLSVVLSTYNEEKNIKDCLESVKDIADEIIVVDGSSSDNTVAIAKSYGAKVKVTDNPPIFLINRQKAIDMASQDWLLNLDADERLTPALRSEIAMLLKNKNKIGNQNGFWIPRKNWFLGRYLMKGGVYPDYQLRLYRRGKVHFALKHVHEQAIVEGLTGYLEHPLEHLSDPYFKRYLIRFNRYTDRIADDFREQKVGKNPIQLAKYMAIMPLFWFFWVYVRHKGFLDSWQGFVFSFFSALRFPVSYIKYLRNSDKINI